MAKRAQARGRPPAPVSPVKGGAGPEASPHTTRTVPSPTGREAATDEPAVGRGRDAPRVPALVVDAVASPSARAAARREPEIGDDLVEAHEARHAIATLTIIRVCRARVALRMLHALTRWRAHARSIAMDELIGEQLAPLLASRAQMLNQLHLDPEEYVAFGEEAPAKSPCAVNARASAGETSLELALLRDELRTAESGLSTSASRLEPPSSPPGRDDVRLRLEFGGAIGGLGVGTSPPLSASPAMDEHEIGQRSPTSSDASATPTSVISRSASSHATGGLTLKQLSEGDRALKAAFEREMRRAADLAKVKLKLERKDKQLERAQQALRDSLAETERLRAELAAATTGGKSPVR